jgi:hypothetical protein
LIPLFAATLFLSATLIFTAEPIIGKLIVPLLGGSPAVWNTCVMFFQLELLAGYLYVHAIARRLTERMQFAVQLVLLGVGLFGLPLALGGDVIVAAERPIRTVLLIMTHSIGLPLLGIVATAPLLQQWFAGTRAWTSNDPYFLYAASNLGSLLALLAYPFLIEPGLSLTSQRKIWTAGYIALYGLTAICAWIADRSKSPIPAGVEETRGERAARGPIEPVPLWRRARWVLLACVPSSLVLSVTMHISTNISAVPLLWVIPLGLYVFTFVLAFAKPPVLSTTSILRLLPITTITALCALAFGASENLWFIPVHLVALLVAAAACHQVLAVDRPSTTRLTGYYVSIAVGGVLGGVFNTLVAPVIFTQALEYPIGLLLVALLPWTAGRRRQPSRSAWGYAVDFAVPVVVALAAFVILHEMKQPSRILALDRGLSTLQLSSVSTEVATTTIAIGIPFALALLLADTPFQFDLTIAALALVVALAPKSDGRVLFEERTFFGTHRIADIGELRILTHGTTTHGMQSTRPRQQCEPLAYYTRTGPLGQLFETFRDRLVTANIASVGLGAATIAAYSQPAQHWTFFEINPTAVRIAQNPRYFSYLQDCVQHYRVLIGDARLEIAREPDQSFHLIVLDAFGSDAVPTHLVTREAMAIYLRKLAPRGVLAFHLSNRYLDLGPVVGSLAGDAGLTGLIERDLDVSVAETLKGKLGSEWAVVARAPEDLGGLTEDTRWRPLHGSAGSVWTDDYSNILPFLKFPRL